MPHSLQTDGYPTRMLHYCRRSLRESCVKNTKIIYLQCDISAITVAKTILAYTKGMCAEDAVLSEYITLSTHYVI